MKITRLTTFAPRTGAGLVSLRRLRFRLAGSAATPRTQPGGGSEYLTFPGHLLLGFLTAWLLGASSSAFGLLFGLAMYMNLKKLPVTRQGDRLIYRRARPI